MTDARDGSSRTVRQFQFIDWPEQGVPKSGEGFIDFIGQVHKTKEQFGQDGPITVHCSAGVGRTGNLKIYQSFGCFFNHTIDLHFRCVYFVEHCLGTNAI